jgi:type IV pilus assembly protein PilV
MRTRIHTSKGFSLVEMLIALLIFSIGLLALALLHVKGLGLSRDSAQRSQAIAAARGLADAIKLNPGAIYTLPPTNTMLMPAECNVMLNTSAGVANGNCPCLRAQADQARTLAAMRGLLPPTGPGATGLLEIRREASRQGAIPPTHNLAPNSCVAPIGTSYLVTMRWSEGGGAAFGAANNQSISVVVMP